MFKKFVFLYIIIMAVVVGQTPTQAYKFEFDTVTDIVKKVRAKFNEFDSYSANFTVTTTKQGKSSVQTGSIKSKKPNYLFVQFTSPSNQKIISDGKMMWVYIPSMNVVAEQDLKEDKGTVFTSGTNEGLKRLFSKYHYKFASKEQPVTEADGKKYYKIFLQQKESRSGYKTMVLTINEDFLITKAVGETSSGKTITLEFTNININENFQKGLFKLEIPSNAKIIKNPMISEE